MPAMTFFSATTFEAATTPQSLTHHGASLDDLTDNPVMPKLPKHSLLDSDPADNTCVSPEQRRAMIRTLLDEWLPGVLDDPEEQPHDNPASSPQI